MRPELSAGGERSLRNFLGELVWRHFFEDVRLEEPQVTTYVASLLADFACTENLYRIRSAQGKRLEEVGEMLIESNPLLEAASLDREREVRKHVGELHPVYDWPIPGECSKGPPNAASSSGCVHRFRAGRQRILRDRLVL